MINRKMPWWKTMLILLSVVAVLISLGFQMLIAFGRDQVQWAYMDKMRSGYFLEYYIVHGRWPSDLSGTSRWFQSDDDISRDHLDRMHPTLEIAESSNQCFKGTLDFHSFLSAHYDVEVGAPAKEAREQCYKESISQEFMPAYFHEHHSWPTDLSDVQRYYSNLGSLQSEAILKLHGDLAPTLVAKKVNDHEFDGMI